MRRGEGLEQHASREGRPAQQAATILQRTRTGTSSLNDELCASTQKGKQFALLSGPSQMRHEHDAGDRTGSGFSDRRNNAWDSKTGDKRDFARRRHHRLREGQAMSQPENPQKTFSAPPVAGSARQAPPKFEPALVPRLLGVHKALNTRFEHLVTLIDREPAACAPLVEECARQFSALRHIETIWLYPVIADAVAGDAGASRQFTELRLVGLMLARRAQRFLDELSQAFRAEVLVKDAADRATVALARYLAHSERAIYPLYELIGSEKKAASGAA
jgi:hypothetical protein